MSKKDYELFANEIYSTSGKYGADDVKEVVELCKRVFKQDNPLFNPDKFERACYEGKHIRKGIKTT